MNSSSWVCDVGCDHEPPIPLCDLKPPPFPRCWIDGGLIEVITNNPQWRNYSDQCLRGREKDVPKALCSSGRTGETKPGAEASLGWVAVPVLLILCLIAAILAFFLYKKKACPLCLQNRKTWQPNMSLYQEVNYLDNKNRRNEAWIGHKNQQVTISEPDHQRHSNPVDASHVQTNNSAVRPPENLNQKEFDTIRSISSGTMPSSVAPTATQLGHTDLDFSQNIGTGHSPQLTSVMTAQNIGKGHSSLTLVLTPTEDVLFASRKGLNNPAFQSDYDIKKSEIPPRLPPLGCSDNSKSNVPIRERKAIPLDHNNSPLEMHSSPPKSPTKRRKKKNVLRPASHPEGPRSDRGSRNIPADGQESATSKPDRKSY